MFYHAILEILKNSMTPILSSAKTFIYIFTFDKPSHIKTMYYYYVKCSEIEVLNFNKLLSFNFQLAHILQTVTYHNSVLLLCLDGPHLTNGHHNSVLLLYLDRTHLTNGHISQQCATIMLRWPISYKQSHITKFITEFNLQLSCLILTFCLTGQFGITCVFLSVLIYFSLLVEVTKLSMSGFCPRHADEP